MAANARGWGVGKRSALTLAQALLSAPPPQMRDLFNKLKLISQTYFPPTN